MAERVQPCVKACFDPPKTLADLQAAAFDPQSSHNIHQPVEDGTATDTSKRRAHCLSLRRRTQRARRAESLRQGSRRRELRPKDATDPATTKGLDRRATFALPPRRPSPAPTGPRRLCEPAVARSNPASAPMRRGSASSVSGASRVSTGARAFTAVRGAYMPAPGANRTLEQRLAHLHGAGGRTARSVSKNFRQRRSHSRPQWATRRRASRSKSSTRSSY